MERRSPERRKHLRAPIAARVRSKEGDQEEIWFTQDISEGGLFLKTEKPPYVGMILNLEISLPDTEDLLRLKSEVIWRHEGKGCGVRFLRVTAAQRKILKLFTESP